MQWCCDASYMHTCIHASWPILKVLKTDFHHPLNIFYFHSFHSLFFYSLQWYVCRFAYIQLVFFPSRIYCKASQAPVIQSAVRVMQLSILYGYCTSLTSCTSLTLNSIGSPLLHPASYTLPLFFPLLFAYGIMVSWWWCACISICESCVREGDMGGSDRESGHQPPSPTFHQTFCENRNNSMQARIYSDSRFLKFKLFSVGFNSLFYYMIIFLIFSRLMLQGRGELNSRNAFLIKCLIFAFWWRVAETHNIY